MCFAEIAEYRGNVYVMTTFCELLLTIFCFPVITRGLPPMCIMDIDIIGSCGEHSRAVVLVLEQLVSATVLLSLILNISEKVLSDTRTKYHSLMH